MKNTIIAGLILLSGNLLAQNPKFSYSLEADGGVSRLQGQQLIQQFWGPSAHAGISFQYRLAEQLRLGTGVHYQFISSRSELINFTNQNGADLGTSRMQSSIHYIQIPALVEYTFSGAGRTTLYAGVYGGLNLADDMKVLDGIDFPIAEPADGSYFEKYDAGLAAGVQYDLHRGDHWTLAGQLRGQYGLMNISKEAETSENENSGTRSLGIGVVLKRNAVSAAG